MARGPHNVTTETFARPGAQLAEMLASKRHLGVPPGQGTNRQRQAGRRKQAKAVPTPEAPEATPAKSYQHLLGRV